MLSSLFNVTIDKGVDSVPYRIPGTAYFSHKLIRKYHGLGLYLARANVAPIILSAFSVTAFSNAVKNTPLAISTLTPAISHLFVHFTTLNVNKYVENVFC